MPHTFPGTAQSALIVGGPPGPQPTPPSARRSVDDADFIGEKRVQGDPRGPGGPPHNFGGIRSFGKKYVALGRIACPTSIFAGRLRLVHPLRSSDVATSNQACEYESCEQNRGAVLSPHLAAAAFSMS